MKTHRLKRLMSIAMIAFSAMAVAAPAQGTAAASKDAKPLSKGQLEQLVAPIALYPDSLVSQILMASTYPLEIVQAERWLKQNKKLKGDALAKALEKQTWDPSIRSLINFPQVLGMMNERLDWTQKLGDAVLSEKAAVMDAVQALRKRAKDAGQLKTTKEQKVTEKTIPPTETILVESKVIVIESASPSVVYVPTYNPTIVYGAWPYPAYPPAYYYPPAYRPGAAAWGFAAGVALTAAWGYAWGGCSWGHHGHGDINFNNNRNANFNGNINRGNFGNNRPGNRQGNRAGNRQGNRAGNRQGNRAGGGGNSWRHNPSNRKGVRYGDNKTAQKFNRGSGGAGAGNRSSYRGRTGGNRAGTGRTGTGNRAGTGNRSGTGGRSAARGSSGGSRGSAFKGSSGRSRSSAKRSASRGKSSRYSGGSRSSGARRSSGSRGSRSSRGGGRSRGGGGRSRGGGGRSRGGGGRR